jgi:hypothetical protein
MLVPARGHDVAGSTRVTSIKPCFPSLRQVPPRRIISHFFSGAPSQFASSLASITFVPPVALSIVHHNLPTYLPANKTDNHLSSLALLTSSSSSFLPALSLPRTRVRPRSTRVIVSERRAGRFTTVSLNNMFECACLLLPPASCLVLSCPILPL